MVIFIHAQKGGSGKTTTSLALSSYLGYLEYKVCLIDLDGQCNASLIGISDYERIRNLIKPKDTIASILDEDIPLKVYPSKMHNVDMIPSHADLSEANRKLPQLIEKEKRLLYSIEGLKKIYDFIIIDGPPDLNDLPINGFVAADYVLVPCNPRRFDIEGIRSQNKIIQTIQKMLNPKLKILGYLVTQRDQTNISSEVIQFLSSYTKHKLFDTQIPRNIKVAEAEGALLDIFSYDSYCPAAFAYKKLIENEILPKLNSNL